MTFVANYFELPDADASLNMRKEIPADPSIFEQPSQRILMKEAEKPAACPISASIEEKKVIESDAFLYRRETLVAELLPTIQEP